MTFREKQKLLHPELVDPEFTGGCANCPYHYGYEQRHACENASEENCAACWDREIPEGKPMTQEEQELHDREINEEILRGYCANYDLCSDGCPIFQDEDLRKLVCSGRGARGPFYVDAQLAALDAFKSVLPAEDVTADQCGTCRFGENDCEDWPCNECVDYDEWMPRFSVSVTTQESGTMPEEPQNPDAWEDTSFGGYRHKKIAEELTALYVRKNADYGDSFHRSYLDWGMPMAAIRLGDKYNRLVSLVKNKGDTQVKDESLRDTLIDLANYAIMTVMELDNESKGAF